MQPKNIIVTGGAGFIGSALVRDLLRSSPHRVLVLDALTYAGNLSSLQPVAKHPQFEFVEGDICDAALLDKTLSCFAPEVVVHLAAESHVDRSIDGPAEFIRTNIVGTYNLLDRTLAYWRSLDPDRAAGFRFHHVSTDEVFGALGDTGSFTEQTAYDPRSPYSATKAGSDHLVRAWHHTYGLPVVVTSCSNNYGHYHFPEKLIPLMIIKCLAGEPLPVYGNGSNIRDWLFVDDHARALRTVFETGQVGETYLIGGNSERSNLEVVECICDALDIKRPRADGQSYRTQISFVNDRPGHDFRYSVDSSKLATELDWKPQESFESGINKTVDWYLDNHDWWQAILSGAYRGERLGLSGPT